MSKYLGYLGFRFDVLIGNPFNIFGWNLFNDKEEFHKKNNQREQS